MNSTINIGLGFRRDLANYFLSQETINPDFIEFAPENWIDMGGYWGNILKQAEAKYPVTCHGLSLSLGSAEELDWQFLKQLKQFLHNHNVEIYSEHLSYTKAANAHLYDLLPIPFKQDAIYHVANRIKQVQDFLERKIAIENVSYYTSVDAEMDEATFISEIVKEADCNLLLDINNVFVNAFNHNYHATDFIERIPLDKVAYIHMAGHEQVAHDLIIDTHGEAIVDPVYDLFEWTIQKMKPVPVLLERDFNFPEINKLQQELNNLRNICKKYWEVNHETK